MSSTGPSHDAPPLQMIEAMTRCAYQLGVAAAGIAQRAGDDDTARFLAFSTEFRHCFFAVRMGIRLSHLAVVAPRAVAPAQPLERERPEAVERDDVRLRTEADRERERDHEPVSLPRFLRSLGLAVTGAEQVRAELPAHVRDTTLPALRELLRQTTAPPGHGAVALLASPPTAPASRARLLNSTGTRGVPPLPPIPPARRSSG